MLSNCSKTTGRTATKLARFAGEGSIVEFPGLTEVPVSQKSHTKKSSCHNNVCGFRGEVVSVVVLPNPAVVVDTALQKHSISARLIGHSTSKVYTNVMNQIRDNELDR